MQSETNSSTCCHKNDIILSFLLIVCAVKRLFKPRQTPPFACQTDATHLPVPVQSACKGTEKYAKTALATAVSAPCGKHKAHISGKGIGCFWVGNGMFQGGKRHGSVCKTPQFVEEKVWFVTGKGVVCDRKRRGLEKKTALKSPAIRLYARGKADGGARYSVESGGLNGGESTARDGDRAVKPPVSSPPRFRTLRSSECAGKVSRHVCSACP